MKTMRCGACPNPIWVRRNPSRISVKPEFGLLVVGVDDGPTVKMHKDPWVLLARHEDHDLSPGHTGECWLAIQLRPDGQGPLHATIGRDTFWHVYEPR